MILELILEVFEDTITKLTEDFVENCLLKNPNYYVIDENGEKKLNELGTVALLYFIDKQYDMSVKEVEELLHDEDFMKGLLKYEENN